MCGESVFGCGHQITEITVCPALRYSRLKHAVLTPHSTETIQTLPDGCYRRAMRRRCQTRESNINFATKTDKVWQTTYCGGTSCRFLHLSLHTITIHTSIGYIYRVNLIVKWVTDTVYCESAVDEWVCVCVWVCAKGLRFRVLRKFNYPKLKHKLDTLSPTELRLIQNKLLNKSVCEQHELYMR